MCLPYQAGDRDSGRITADTLLAYLAAQHLVVDEWKIRKMVAEADFDECGLTPAVVRSCLEVSMADNAQHSTPMVM